MGWGKRVLQRILSLHGDGKSPQQIYQTIADEGYAYVSDKESCLLIDTNRQYLDLGHQDPYGMRKGQGAPNLQTIYQVIKSRGVGPGSGSESTFVAPTSCRCHSN